MHLQEINSVNYIVNYTCKIYFAPEQIRHLSLRRGINVCRVLCIRVARS